MLAKEKEEVKKSAEQPSDWKVQVKAPPKDNRFKTTV